MRHDFATAHEPVEQRSPNADTGNRSLACKIVRLVAGERYRPTSEKRAIGSSAPSAFLFAPKPSAAFIHTSKWGPTISDADPRDDNAKSGFVMRSEGGRICCDFNGLSRPRKYLSRQGAWRPSRNSPPPSLPRQPEVVEMMCVGRRTASA